MCYIIHVCSKYKYNRKCKCGQMETVKSTDFSAKFFIKFLFMLLSFYMFSFFLFFFCLYNHSNHNDNP